MTQTAPLTPTLTPSAAITLTATAPVTSAGAPVPLQLGSAQFSLFTVNPEFTLQWVAFTLSRPAYVWVKITPAGATQPVRTMTLGLRPGGRVEISWDGRDDAHALVPEGNYHYEITALDRAGDRVSESYDGLGITYKRIVVSLSQQRLTAYDGKTSFLTSLVTTGNSALPTPLGVFPILARYHPFTFISPWPRGSKFYYPPSPVSYALLFDDRGYYIHDAPWRGAFGPGTNAQTGTPGQNYTGTHGCVNVPFAVAQQLFDWATIGTIVQVVP